MFINRRQARYMQWVVEDTPISKKPRTDVKTFGWRYEVSDKGGQLTQAKGMNRINDRKLRQYEGDWERTRRNAVASSDRRHNFYDLHAALSSTPLSGCDKPNALYNTLPGDQVLRPTNLPPYIVHSDLRITEAHNWLGFYVYSWGLQFQSPQAFRLLRTLLSNNSSLECIDILTWDTGLVFRCKIKDTSPEALAEINNGGYPIRVMGITDLKLFLEQKMESNRNVSASVVLRGSESCKEFINLVENTNGTVRFPNFISFDSLGLGASAGVFSHPVSLKIGGEILSEEYTEAVKSIVRTMPRVNAGLKSSEEDLDQETRDFRMSSRFANQIPPRHSWVRTLIKDRILNSSYSAIYELYPEILNKFTASSAAAVWNSIATERLKLNCDHAIPGDILLCGDIYKGGQEISIDKVAIPTIGPGLDLREWPVSCGGVTAVAAQLEGHGIRTTNLQNNVLLPNSTLRPITAVATDVKVVTKRGSLTEYAQGFWGTKLREKEAPSLVLKTATGKLYGKEWACVPCAVVNPATAIRCQSCSEHVSSEVNPESVKLSSLSKLKTHFITATIPEGASMTSLLTEYFDLYAYHPFPDQPHVAALLEQATSGNRYARLGSGKKFPGLKKYRTLTRGVEPEPRLPAGLESAKKMYEWRFQHPSSPLASPTARLVELKPHEEVREV
eukprot:TRINITY_DN19969_c0_g1_i1.p1 TRINITY_DN19969_c0_g1~~TRINITY_DN19969_c0_g1_i1.p1  ORF type:complete len:672 (+),score=93.75 TRINITY_DN19969_c0_g1_i1:81-2096(+)